MPQHVLRHLVRRTRYVLVIVGEESGRRHPVPFLSFGKTKARRMADRLNAKPGDHMTHWEVEPDGGVES